MISDNFRWDISQKTYIDQEQMIRAALYEIIKIYFQRFTRFTLKMPVLIICTKFCVGVSSFLKKQKKAIVHEMWTSLSNLKELFLVTTLLKWTIS